MFSGKESKKELEELINASTTIGKGTVIDGNLTTVGNIRIEGNITGNISSQAKISIGDSAIIKGDIEVQNAEIAGNITGNLTVKELLILKATAVVTGNVICDKLAVENGAKLNGTYTMQIPSATK